MDANEFGASRVKVFFWLSLLFLIVYVGFKLAPMYFDYYRMEDEMASKASMAQALKDEEIIADLVKKAKELDLPLTEENFVLKRDVDLHRMLITTQWDVEVHFLFDVYVRTFHFAPKGDEDFRISRR
jgi:hypothetical protein